MLINFALVQFVPGGPVEQILAQLERETDVFQGIAGGGGEIREASESSSYVGSQGLPEDFVADLERQFGFDKPPLERRRSSEMRVDGPRDAAGGVGASVR